MQVTLNMDSEARRPIVQTGWFHGCRAMLDTSLYQVNFVLNGLIYVDMPIVVKEMENLQYHLILSATMFENMVYEIDMRRHILNIDTEDNQPVRLLRVSDDNGKFSVYLAGTYENEEICRAAQMGQLVKAGI